jgi:hypothetical protein
MVCFVTLILTTIFVEGDIIISNQESNLAAFVLLFLLITIEVVVVKVITAESEREDENYEVRAVAAFFDRE